VSAKRVARSAAVVPDPTSATDGRVRRGERSRQAIVAALFDLVGGGVLQPTAQQVAARAGVGIRSVFRHFAEMESLFAAMAARLEAQAQLLLAGGRRSGSVAERARALVRQRTELFELIAPYKRSANVQRWRSRFLQDRHRRLLQALRADRQQWLPELGRAPADLQEAVDLALGFEAWDRLRGDRSLSQKVAALVMERTVLALLHDAQRRHVSGGRILHRPSASDSARTAKRSK
jgi:AcrR family transcriptional regulator